MRHRRRLGGSSFSAQRLSASPQKNGRTQRRAQREGLFKMIAVIFEVWPKPGHKQRYLDLAAELRPLLDTIDGFIAIERFESLYEPGKMLCVILPRRSSGERMEKSRTPSPCAGPRPLGNIFELSIADCRRDQGLRHVRSRAGSRRQPFQTRLTAALITTRRPPQSAVRCLRGVISDGRRPSPA